MKKIIGWILSVVMLLATSCSTVKISTIKNQEKRIIDNHGIVIYSNSSDIEFRNTLETIIKDNFTKCRKNSIQSINLFPPLKSYSIEEIYEVSKKNNFDSILFISQTGSEKETGYILLYGVLVPTSTVNNSFDVQFIDLKDGVGILHSTVKAEGDTLNSMAKSVAKKIVSEILTEECKEFIPIIQNLFGQDLKLKQLSAGKYSIVGKTKIGDLCISNSKLEIKLPSSFNVVKDIRGLTETLVDNRGSYCRITTNDVNDLEYIVGLLKEYNATK